MPIKTILVIEDDRFIGEMYVRSLKKAGYEVDWMVGGNDGLIAARNKKYDSILLDIMLPERRGSEIMDARFAATKTLFLALRSSLLRISNKTKNHAWQWKAALMRI